MSATLVEVDPPSSCSSVRVMAEDCNCALEVELSNHCEVSSTLGVDDCQASDVVPEPCITVAPAATGTARVYLERTGELEKVFTLTDSEGEHLVKATAKVTEFRGTSCISCEIQGGRGDRYRPLAWLVACAVLLRRLRPKRS